MSLPQVSESPAKSVDAPDESHRTLALYLRAVAVVDLCAALAVFMPRSTMAAVHAWLGLGVMPADAITGYLARTASLFYVLTGGLLLFVARDVARYRSLIRWIARCGVLIGVALLGIDIAEGLPAWWIVTEGPSCVLLSVIALLLQEADRA